MDAKKAVLVLNGVFPDPSILTSYNSSAYIKIAVDGGLKYFRHANISPDILIGDLDSVSLDDRAWAEQQSVQILQYPPEKDTSDFELALTWVIQQGIPWVRILAALGGRLDQTMANCFLLMNDQLNGMDVRFEDGKEEVCLIQHSITLHGQPGDIVSLIPLQPVVYGVTTHDLKYPLHDEDLSMHQARGISNVMLTTSAAVEIKEGLCLIIHTRQGR
jgi:thiamine pyrophosphokinase